ncbi:hypothetical protein BC936DRAFT_140084 [Jimgerdemannia flammicorona]|uniref:Uncharacterized protein n=1 Tax=Jimgerdemannia flammicorona TaxID=994334 RepID=A0A433B2R6_9FUNG|nr:hypothetical protein BC936DRAFT_140084 [Jimgerdemannia flammicorona]
MSVSPLSSTRKNRSSRKMKRTC